MCQTGVVWDDPPTKHVQPEWENWISVIKHLQHVKIPKHLKPADFGSSAIVELYHFSDASNVGYGQCSYIMFVREERIHCSLLVAKARVAPQMVVTVPRLELTAAVLSVKMSLFLRDELNLSIDREYFWTDSCVVLGYINNEARRFHVFVANRVQLIRESTELCQWFYARTGCNPAHHASRGLPAAGIANSTWLNGLPFLWQREIKTENIDTELQLGGHSDKNGKVSLYRNYQLFQHFRTPRSFF